jgi:hypothetical protein
MQILGIIIIVAALIYTFTSIGTEVPCKRIITFASIFLAAAAFLIFADTTTNWENPILGKFSRTIEKAKNDANEIARIKGQVEQQKKEIDSVVKEAHLARENLNNINAINQFSMTLLDAQNGDVDSYIKLQDFGLAPGPFQELANNSLFEISSNIFRNYTFGVDPEISWEYFSFSPTTASLEEFQELYKKVYPRLRTCILSYIWKQERFSLYQRLDFLSKVIKSETNFFPLQKACLLMDEQAKIRLTAVKRNSYVEWWEKNKGKYLRK